MAGNVLDIRSGSIHRVVEVAPVGITRIVKPCCLAADLLDESLPEAKTVLSRVMCCPDVHLVNLVEEISIESSCCSSTCLKAPNQCGGRLSMRVRSCARERINAKFVSSRVRVISADCHGQYNSTTKHCIDDCAVAVAVLNTRERYRAFVLVKSMVD